MLIILSCFYNQILDSKNQILDQILCLPNDRSTAILFQNRPTPVLNATSIYQVTVVGFGQIFLPSFLELEF